MVWDGETYEHLRTFVAHNMSAVTAMVMYNLPRYVLDEADHEHGAGLGSHPSSSPSSARGRVGSNKGKSGRKRSPRSPRAKGLNIGLARSGHVRRTSHRNLTPTAVLMTGAADGTLRLWVMNSGRALPLQPSIDLAAQIRTLRYAMQYSCVGIIPSGEAPVGGARGAIDSSRWCLGG